MAGFVRSLCITICSALFSFIPKLYKLFYDLASQHDLFEAETIQTFSKNIYVLTSVVMLFAFAIKAIESIINPDMLWESKKGFLSVIKRSAIALLLIVAVPFGFDFFYKFQDEVMSKSLIEKLIIGVAVNEENLSEGGGNLAEDSGAGQMLASTALVSVLYPAGENKDTCQQYEDSSVCTNYNAAVEDITKLYKVIPDINEKVEGSDGEEEYVLEFEAFGLLSVLIGIVMIYMLVLFCIDTALRLVKLGFLEITAPISIIAYIFGGNDILKKWFGEVKTAALSLFARVAALALMIFVLSRLPEFVAKNFDGLYGGLINLLIIVATLIFVKEAPSMIERIFGVKVGDGGGIKGRLGSMAASDTLKKIFKPVAKAGTMGAAALGGLAGAGLGYAAKGLDDKLLGGKAQNAINQLKNSKAVSAVSSVGTAAKEGIKAGGGIKGLKAATNSYKTSAYGTASQALKEDAKNQQFAQNVGVDHNTGQVLGSTDDITKAQKAATKLDNQLQNSGLAKHQKDAISKKVQADRDKAVVEKAQSHHNDIKDILNNAANRTNSQALINLCDDFNKGKISLSDMRSRVSGMVGKDLSATEANNIIDKLNNLNNMAKSSTPGGQLIADLINSNGGISGAALGASVSSLTTAATNADTRYNKVKDSSSEKTKAEMDRYTSNATIIEKEYVKEVGKSSQNEFSKVTTTTTTSTQEDIDQQGWDALYEANMAMQEEKNNRTSHPRTATARQTTNPDISDDIGDFYENLVYGPQYDDSSSTSNTRSNSDTSNLNGSQQPKAEATRQNSNHDVTDEVSDFYENSVYGPQYDNSSSTTNKGETSKTTNSENNNQTIINQQSETTNNQNSTSTDSNSDLSGFFDTLSQNIKDANTATNTILNDQLKAQQSMLDESKKQNQTLNNMSSDIGNIKGTMSDMNTKIDRYGTQAGKQLENITQEIKKNNKNNE